MASDPGVAYQRKPWAVRLAVAYLWLIRHGVRFRVLPLRWALRVTASFYRPVKDAGPGARRPSTP